jgi:hypothetical protein
LRHIKGHVVQLRADKWTAMLRLITCFRSQAIDIVHHD